MNLKEFKHYVMVAFSAADTMVKAGANREALLTKWSERDLDAFVTMGEAGYPEEYLDARLWESLYESWETWEEPEIIENQPAPEPGMFIQRRGEVPRRVRQFYPVGTFRKGMIGDEAVAWVETEDGVTSCEGTYRVLGYAKGDRQAA